MLSDSSGTSSNGDTIHTFLAACTRRMKALVAAQPAAIGAAAFEQAVERSMPIDFEPGWLPALDTINNIDMGDSTDMGGHSPLSAQFVEIAPLLPWEPTFRTDDRGADIALAPLDRVRHLGGLTVGLMYIRPGCAYPLHAHPPHELYLTISGHGEWRFGGSTEFQRVAPDSVLYNRPGDLHSAVAGDTPLVALYVLWD